MSADLKPVYVLGSEKICRVLKGPAEQSRNGLLTLAPEHMSDLRARGEALRAGFVPDVDNTLYHHFCVACRACTPARIDVNVYEPSKDRARLFRRNADLICELTSPEQCDRDETFDLYSTFRRERHGQDSDRESFEESLKAQQGHWRYLQFRDPEGRRLLASLMMFGSDDGAYSNGYYRPGQPGRGLGIFMILKAIENVRDNGGRYLYLGSATRREGSYHYKNHFRSGLEVLGPYGWTASERLPDYRREDRHAARAIFSFGATMNLETAAQIKKVIPGRGVKTKTEPSPSAY